MPHKQHSQHLVRFVLDKSLSSQLRSNHAFNYFFFPGRKIICLSFCSGLQTFVFSLLKSFPTLLLD